MIFAGSRSAGDRKSTRLNSSHDQISYAVFCLKKKTTWCLGQCSERAITAAYLDPDAAHEIFNAPHGILAWGAIAHEVQAVPGGYRFFFNDTATTEIYTLSLHDALPISPSRSRAACRRGWRSRVSGSCACASRDRKSTRLNSSHDQSSYAAFCLKKKTSSLAAVRQRRFRGKYRLEGAGFFTCGDISQPYTTRCSRYCCFVF